MGRINSNGKKFVIDNCVLEGQRICYCLEETAIGLHLKAFLFKVWYFMTL